MQIAIQIRATQIVMVEYVSFHAIQIVLVRVKEATSSVYRTFASTDALRAEMQIVLFLKQHHARVQVVRPV